MTGVCGPSKPMDKLELIIEKLKELEERIESLEKHVLNLVADMIERKGR